MERKDLCIKLSLDKDSMYHNLIAPSHKNKQLTSLILKLLRVYYEDENIHNAIEGKVNSELADLQQEIARMQKCHLETMSKLMHMEDEVSVFVENTKCKTQEKEDSKAEGVTDRKSSMPIEDISSKQENKLVDIGIQTILGKIDTLAVRVDDLTTKVENLPMYEKSSDAVINKGTELAVIEVKANEVPISEKKVIDMVEDIGDTETPKKRRKTSKGKKLVGNFFEAFLDT